MIPSETIDLLLETANDTAVGGGGVIPSQGMQPQHPPPKGFRDLLTETDLASQQLITNSLRGRFPDHAFLPEETDSSLPTEGPVTWVIDPIDGTTNYSRQTPIFCVSIAAAVNDQALVGVIYDPMRDELFSAAAGRGCTLNGQPARVSDVSSLQHTVVSLDWSHSRQRRQGTLDVLGRFAHRIHTVRAIGSAALALAWLAAGRVDGYLNFNLKPWDVAAGGLMITEAGGRLTDVAGQPYKWTQPNSDCFASNGRIHADFLRLLAGPKR
jgi:myo-inositol-1(or 4)-monophosphatase